MESIRPLQPLLASITTTFANFSKRTKEGFWNIGTSILNLVHKGAIFDTEVKLHPIESDEDNFDIALDTAGKISILQPIMRPAILSPIMEELRSQCEQVLEQTLNTFSAQERLR